MSGPPPGNQVPSVSSQKGWRRDKPASGPRERAFSANRLFGRKRWRGRYMSLCEERGRQHGFLSGQ